MNKLRREIYWRLLMLSDDFYDFSHRRKWHKGLAYAIASGIDLTALKIAPLDLLKEKAKPYIPE